MSWSRAIHGRGRLAILRGRLRRVRCAGQDGGPRPGEWHRHPPPPRRCATTTPARAKSWTRSSDPARTGGGRQMPQGLPRRTLVDTPMSNARGVGTVGWDNRSPKSEATADPLVLLLVPVGTHPIVVQSSTDQPHLPTTQSDAFLKPSSDRMNVWRSSPCSVRILASCPSLNRWSTSRASTTSPVQFWVHFLPSLRDRLDERIGVCTAECQYFAVVHLDPYLDRLVFLEDVPQTPHRGMVGERHEHGRFVHGIIPVEPPVIRSTREPHFAVVSHRM